MLAFLSSVLGALTVGFYFFMVAAFIRRASHDYPGWGLGARLAYALTWPVTVWDSPNNPARRA